MKKLKGSKSIILVIFIALNFNIIHVKAIELPETVTEQIISKLGKVSAISFRATQTVEYFKDDMLLPDLGLARTIDGTQSPKGEYRFEIDYTHGNFAGQKYNIYFNGARNFFVDTNGNASLLATKRGEALENPYLLQANPIVEPFSFLNPKILDPNQQGLFIKLSDLVSKKTWEEWLAKSKLQPSSTLENKLVVSEILSEGEKLNVILEIGSTDFLPKSIMLMLPSEEIFIEKRIFDWQDVSDSNGVSYRLPKKIKIERNMDDNTMVVITTSIQEIKFLSAVPDSFWSYDISKAGTIYDSDEKVIIHSEKSK